jgi:hypothetical protein
LAYDLAGAAIASSISERTIRAAVKSGRLLARFNGVRPVILLEDLAAYLRALPTDAIAVADR